MEKFIRKISSILSFIVIFFASAIFYFNFKGFDYVDGQIVLKPQEAQAVEKKTFAELPANLVINASQKYAEGSKDAPLTMYEYSSFDCPHCADFHLDIMPDIEKEYVEKGLLRVIFVNFPLSKNAMNVALLSRCIPYDQYKQFVNTMFLEQRSWWNDKNNKTIFKLAAKFGLTNEEAEICIKNNTEAQNIIADRQEAMTRLNMQGTPAFLFSGTDGNEIIYGVPTKTRLTEYLNDRLARLSH
ncbi:MAG: thioredoxin domain-containing protein [Alphaproteobacteria bacterium]|nr:thioredoxin domain-containing protein [Alphaproteobacteria bacterium]